MTGVKIIFGASPERGPIHDDPFGVECTGTFNAQGICNGCGSSKKEIELARSLFEDISRTPENHPRVRSFGSSREVLSRDGE